MLLMVSSGFSSWVALGAPSQVFAAISPPSGHPLKALPTQLRLSTPIVTCRAGPTSAIRPISAAAGLACVPLPRWTAARRSPVRSSPICWWCEWSRLLLPRWSPPWHA